jgi:CHAT domain-containing protein
MYEMELTPSGSIWARSGDPGRAREISTVLAIAPHPELLPGSLDEITAIRRSFGKSADVLRGSSASKKRFRESAPGYSVIHLASTGALNKANPFLSYLSMHEANGEDGRLKANEILGLRLSASLVVLSACETALGSGNLADVPPGDDWIGLVQSFLHAGASHVLATLWRVDDRATAKFMTAFYRNLHEGRSPSESVRLAQRAALQDPSVANPFYWAGFALNGVR